MNATDPASLERACRIQSKIVQLLERPGRYILEDCPPDQSRLHREPYVWVHARPCAGGIYIQFAAQDADRHGRTRAVNDMRRLFGDSGITVAEMDEPTPGSSTRASLCLIVKDGDRLVTALDQMIAGRLQRSFGARALAASENRGAER